jgi:hypothetical protein
MICSAWDGRPQQLVPVLGLLVERLHENASATPADDQHSFRPVLSMQFCRPADGLADHGCNGLRSRDGNWITVVDRLIALEASQHRDVRYIGHRQNALSIKKCPAGGGVKSEGPESGGVDGPGPLQCKTFLVAVCSIPKQVAPYALGPKKDPALRRGRYGPGRDWDWRRGPRRLYAGPQP